RNISREKKLTVNPIENKVFIDCLKESLKKALNNTKLIENIKTIHSKSRKKIKDAEILLDADTCFAEGIRLIKSANHKLLTSIAFTGSLEESDNSRWKDIENAIKEKLQSCSTDFVFKRL